jgi:hypothetical protein
MVTFVLRTLLERLEGSAPPTSFFLPSFRAISYLIHERAED